jgi:single-strand DNA-binding protein
METAAIGTGNRKAGDGMNKIILLGNMTRNPKTTRKRKEDGTETVTTKFDLAVNRKIKGENDTDYFHCTSFGRQAEFIEKYFHKGTRVLVVGRLQNNNYTNKQGERIFGFDVITEDVEFGEKKGEERKEG